LEKILNSFACVVENIQLIRGQGCHLFDREGNSYIDFEGGVWSLPLGHSHPRINEVLRTQIEELVHMSYRYRSPIVEKAAGAVLKAVGIASGKCSFLSSGSEAVELAVQITRRISGKPLLLTLSDSYLAAYGSSGTKGQDEWYCFDWKRGSINDIPFEQIGGFVFEPGNAGGLVRFPPVELVQALANKVQQTGGLVVVNEVTAGMGRTGAWFGFMYYGLNPDMVALGKGLGNGYPVSAVAMQQKIAHELEGKAFKYAQSHQNDPLGCAVAAEVISIMEQNNLVERSQTLEPSLSRNSRVCRRSTKSSKKSGAEG
jgi:acetylornithine aminotransferase